jgi:hypothetical protein
MRVSMAEYRVIAPVVVVHCASDVYPARNGVGLVRVQHGSLLPPTVLAEDIENLLDREMIEIEPEPLDAA